MLLLFLVFPFSCDADDIQFLIVVPLVHRITSKFRQTGSSGGFLTFLFSEKTGLALKQSQVGSYHPFDVYSFQHLIFESYLIQDWQHFWTARASGLKEETGFLEAPAEAEGEPGAQRRSVSQCEPAPGATVASGARYFYFRLCPLAMAALEQAAVQMVEYARGRLNRLHRAAEPPNWSHPSQHQTS